MTRPSVHAPWTKSYAIDQIEDIEHLRRVTHRMWEAFQAAHAQTAHAIGALEFGDCDRCRDYLGGAEETGCEKFEAWQAKVSDGFGSV